MRSAPPDKPRALLSAQAGAQDRQRALDEVCRGVLKPFVGREITPTAVVEAEICMRHALLEAIRAGKYVLPDGLALDRVELGADLRIKVYFMKAVDPRFVSVAEELGEK